MLNACSLKLNEKQQLEHQEDSGFMDSLGKILPKDGKTYHLMIVEDNPDIESLKTEQRMSEQALKELEKLIKYNIKVWKQTDGISKDKIDIWLYFTDDIEGGVLAWAGYPFGSLRGIVKFNNNYIWLDGHPRTYEELEALGLLQNGMKPGQSYATFNYKQTLKHELGHTFGLPHTEEDKDVMFAYYREDRIMFGEESKDTLNLKYGDGGSWKWSLPDFYIKAVMRRRI